jgi:hypothetical protein
MPEGFTGLEENAVSSTCALERHHPALPVLEHVFCSEDQGEVRPVDKLAIFAW